MKISIKIFACFVAISIVLLACGNTNTSDNYTKQTEMPAMDSRARYYEQGTFGFGLGEPPLDDKEWGYSLGYFGGIAIHIITDRNMLMSVFSHIFDNEQIECNYFAIHFESPYGDIYRWVLSQDMILHQIVPKESGAVTTVPSVAAMLVCDDTLEGNLKDRIDINSIRTHVDINY